MPDAPEQVELTCTVNGQPVSLKVASTDTLLYLLRYDLELTGTKYGCGEGECGACSVLLDGKVVNSCLVLAAECQGSDILTIEGLAADTAIGVVDERRTIRSGAASFADTFAPLAVHIYKLPR